MIRRHRQRSGVFGNANREEQHTPLELLSAIDEANATSPLEWFAATSIYITHVVNDIEWNKSNLRM